MSRTADLLKRLSSGGITIPEKVKKAMLNLAIESFTDYDCDAFAADRPVPYIEQKMGMSKQFQHYMIMLYYTWN